MASPTSHSAYSHVSNTLTALQGATAAFNESFPKTGLSHVNHNLMRIDEVDRHGPETALQPEGRSAELPEPGSVRDKIGLFAAHSGNNRNLQSLSGSERGNTAASRPRMAQAAAPPSATSKPPVPAKKPSLLAEIGTRSELKQMRPQNSSDTGTADALVSKPVRNMTGGGDYFERPLQNQKELLIKSLAIPPRKPVAQSASPESSNVLQVTTIKVRPSPPLPRKGVPQNAAKPSGLKSREVPQGPKAFANSKSSPAVIDEPRPKLPPRPGALPMTQSAPKDHRLLLDERDTRRGSMTPSSASVSAPSHNNGSNPSFIDQSTGLGEEALSNAIVASSLASAKALSAKKVPPPPPPQRRPGSHSILQLHTARNSSPGDPSPTPSLRQTLRTPTKADEDELEHHNKQRKHIIHKHPHKHHEGDRKRWQSEITEKERKRYEGVWAANKGYLIPISSPNEKSPGRDTSRSTYPPSASEMVLNIVVRELWSRSRLPSTILEQIWNLVDQQKIGLLTREEFVVGMWLIDQQLKGHKLPVKVPDSVWDSVKGVSGIKLSKLPA